MFGPCARFNLRVLVVVPDPAGPVALTRQLENLTNLHFKIFHSTGLIKRIIEIQILNAKKYYNLSHFEQ